MDKNIKLGIFKRLPKNISSWLSLAAVALLVAAMFTTGMVGQILFAVVVALLIIATGASAVGSLISILNNSKEASRNNVLTLIMKFMILFFLLGVDIYFYVFLTISTSQDVMVNNFELILRSVICSLDMFMLDVDSNILDRLDHFAGLKGGIVVISILSFSCTVGMLGSLVYSRAKAHFNLKRKAKVSKDRDHLYIFFGINEATRQLASDIKRNDPRGLTIMVELTNSGNEDESDSFSGIINLLTHKKKSFETADETGAYIALATEQFLNISDEKLKAHGDDLFAAVGLETVRKVIEEIQRIGNKYRTSKADKKSRLMMFFLSDNEDNNIRNIIALAKDKTVKKLSVDDQWFVSQIFCHARVNGPNRVIEDLALRNQLNVKLLDSSHMAVELIKADKAVQPVKFIKMSTTTPGAVAAPLDSLIIGFGEVGRDAFRFLYEFGSFVGEGSDSDNEIVALPRITAIDNRMNALRGDFMAGMPAVDFYGDRIKLLNMDFNERRFYTTLLSPERCKSLNYIVIATGDDETNISLAVGIFNHIRRYRQQMDNLVIMVRSLRDDKLEMMHRTADFYNHGFGEGRKNQPVIRFFGTPSYLYTYNLVIDDKLSNQARTYYESYCEISGGGKTWDERRRLATIGDEKENIIFDTPQLDALQGLRRKENQDRSNALHAETKIEFIRKALGSDEGVAELRAKILKKDEQTSTLKSVRTGRDANIDYPGMTAKEKLLMLNLARLEHLRWNASHELMGYIPTDTHQCDECTKIHNCLRSWNLLDAEAAISGYDYKGYDFAVVETSLKLTNEETNNGIE